MKPTIKTLDSGWTLIRWNAEIWAQIPPGFEGQSIPDEYIFNPEWNRVMINEWWRKQGQMLPEKGE